MSSTSSRAAIRFVIALFLAQTFVNAVAVPHPHIHRVVDARQVVSLPLIEREQPPVNEPKNVFDAIVDTLKGYNGWQVFTDFFRKLFNGAPSSNGSNPWPSVVVIPSPGASATPIDVVSAIESFISEIASTPASVVVVPTDASGSSATESVAVAPTDASESSATESVAVAPTDASESSATDSAEPSATDDPIMSILPIFPITTAIELFPTEEPTIPSELLSEILPEATETSVTQVVIELPTGVLTIPLVTAPVGTGPVEITPSATDAPFPVSNGTLPTILPGTDVPVIIIIPTGIPGPVNGTIEASGSATLEANVTVSLTSTVGLTVTIDPTLIGTDVASVGTGLPVTFTDEPLFPNVTAITPTLILVTGTGASVGTVIPTIGVDPISPLYPNSTTDIATAVAPIGTSVVIIGTGIIGTAVTSIEPVETITLGTGIIGTGTGAAVAPIDTALPLFPNTTAIEIVVEPTFVLGTGTAPVVGTASAAPVSSATDGAIWANTTTTTVTNIVTPSVVGTGIPGTIVVVPGPENTNVLFPNVTITVNATAEATLVLPVATELPVEVVTSVEPIIEPIPTDLPVVEFPGTLALRSICRDPTVHQITLPLLDQFYGPSAYPLLAPFPGCQAANARQVLQAPGLLNCTALGIEVQSCQASGRRVLLSVKGAAPSAVGDNVNFGDPNVYAAPWGGYNGAAGAGSFPNLFDERHVPSAFALTLFSLFGEGRTERADLRPLGPDTPAADGISWVERPLGEEVVVDGFDVQVARGWQGTYQEGKFNELVDRLKELNDEAWTSSGGVKGGKGDLGTDGKGVVYQGWNRKRNVQRVVMVGGFEVLVE